MLYFKPINMKRILTLLTLCALIASAAYAQKPNTLTKKEKKQGWRLLFDGKTTNGWHTYGRDTVGSKWTVKDGMFVFDPSKTGGLIASGGDITTNEEFTNFEFSVEWRVEKASNSGIIFNIQEKRGVPGYGSTTASGPEMQVLDNIDASDNKNETHLAGQLYDMAGGLATSKPKPVGEWNNARIIQKDGHLTLIFNGVTTYDGQIGSPEWNAMVARSKFKNSTTFGKVAGGKIAFQQHPGSSSWRNVKIRPL
jgi:opacity protein-like surface antigen